jgi:hypothetical protein
MRLLGRVRRMGQDAPGGTEGMPPTVVSGLRPGSRVAGYRLEEQIGRGGMALVFRAVDERLTDNQACQGWPK